MSYLVLARKCRPQVFEEVLGQGHVTRTLQNALKTNRTAHAYLFSGPRGVGKTTVARILAKALNCQEGPTPVPCNRCVSCQEITQGISLDVQEIDGASNRGIDDIRELRESIKYLPARSRYKIYIIDEVHMLTGEAFNALLKTLEEPPRHALFIFATTELNKVPLTIYSRCQVFHFRRVALNAVVDHLKTLCAREGVEADERALRLIAKQAEGSVRDSLSLLDQILAFSPEEITEEKVQEILGFVDRRIINDTAWAVLENDGKRLLSRIAEVYEFGYDLKQFLRDLVDYLRNLLLIQLDAGEGSPADFTPEELAEMREKAGKVSPEVLEEVLHFLVRAEGELRRAPQPRLALEMTLLRAARIKEFVPVEEVLERLERMKEASSDNGKGKTSSFSAPPQVREEEPFYSNPSPSPRIARPEFEGEREGSSKGDPFPREKFLEFVRSRYLPLAAYLSHGVPRWAEDNLLEWDFREEPFQLRLLEANGNQKKLEDLVREFFRREIRVVCLGEDKKAAKANKKSDLPSPRGKRLSIQTVLTQPQIKDLIDIFQAEVAEIRLPQER
jgi:DNA polymerase-3 subunit gamma/tau